MLETTDYLARPLATTKSKSEYRNTNIEIETISNDKQLNAQTYVSLI